MSLSLKTKQKQNNKKITWLKNSNLPLENQHTHTNSGKENQIESMFYFFVGYRLHIREQK